MSAYCTSMSKDLEKGGGIVALTQHKIKTGHEKIIIFSTKGLWYSPLPPSIPCQILPSNFPLKI